MPLRLIPPRQGKTKNLYVRGTYLGTFVNQSTKTSKRATAARALRQIERQIECGEFAEKGEPTFSDAAIAYMEAGGDRRFMTPILNHIGAKLLRHIDQAEIDAAALAILPNAAPATRNRQVYTPISAVLKHAGADSKLRRPKGYDGNRTTTWLWPEQAFRLFEEAHKLNHAFGALLQFLCYTGLRLSEALRLTWNDVRLSEGFAYVADTKSGQPRAVFLPPVAVAALANLEGREGRVFGFAKSGHLYHLLRAAAAKAGITLPERAAFHLLRHTWGAWMRRYAGLDTSGLVATGAWKSRAAASRYEHAAVTEEARRAVKLPVPGGEW